MGTAQSELTGDLIDTAGEAWRHECECRYVLAMRNREDRHLYIATITKTRGEVAAKQLETDATALYWKRIKK